MPESIFFIEWAMKHLGAKRLQKYEEEGCSLDMSNLSDCVMVKADSIVKSDRKDDTLVAEPPRMCDCIVFWDDNGLIIGVVELKNRAKHANRIREQIQNGWNLASKALAGAKASHMVTSVILASLAEPWNPQQVREMKKDCYRIKIGKKKLRITTKRCGTHLRSLPIQRIKK